MDTNEHYNAVLKDLEHKRDEINTAINAIRSLKGLAPDGGPIERGPFAKGQLREDSFVGLSIPKAALKLLGIMDKPMSAPEIAELLRTHGVQNESKTFSNTVYSALHREMGRGSVRKLAAKKWALANWYPTVKAQQPKEAHLTDAGGTPYPIAPEQPDEQSQNDASS